MSAMMADRELVAARDEHELDLQRLCDALGAADMLGGMEAAWDADDPIPAGEVAHPTLRKVTAAISLMVRGRAAQRLLDNPELVPDRAAILVSRSWQWLHPRVDVGRKNKAPGGAIYVMPCRIAWSGGEVRLVEPGEQLQLLWVLAGLGHTARGQVDVRVDDTRAIVSREGSELLTGSLAVRDRDEILAWARNMVELANAAHWLMMINLGRYLPGALDRAHAVVRADVLGEHPRTHIPLLDQTKLQSLADEMLLGEDDRPGSVPRLLEKLLSPVAFTRADPLRVIQVFLNRDAKAAVQAAVGDPHIGPKVRKVAREIGTTDVEAVVAAYSERHPGDRLGTKRAADALSVAPDAMASWASTSEFQR